jgi:EAL domain-containing protein (putative c-di-GMP-specific phosphodiesterase class I)
VKAVGKKTEEQTKWHLEAITDANTEWMVAVEPVPFVIGRDEDCNLKLISKWISRRHSEIRRSGDHLWIRDLGSTNGTLVNQKQIKQAELLEPGDIVSVGNFRFSVKRVESKATALAEATCSMDLSDELNYAASIEPKLRVLLRERNVIPHFQPILRFSDLAVVGYEILGRIADEHLPSNPSELLDMAEWLGCASDLSAVFREVGVDVGRNLPGSPLLFANATPVEIYRMDILLESLERIHDMGTLNRIVLEINEKAAADTNEMGRLRDALGKLNIGLAFDDFGVGQTRLVELAKVPPDFLKFDMSLIREIHLAPERLHQMVATFVKAARDLGIATLAEGIECNEEAETCRQLGFDFAQGFFYGRPLPITEINTVPDNEVRQEMPLYLTH